MNISLRVRHWRQEQVDMCRLEVTLGAAHGHLDVPWAYLTQSEHSIPLTEPQKGGDKPSARQVKRRSTKQERKRIEAVGGRRHTGSGALPGMKSDGSVGNEWRMENKFTMAASYRVTLRDLRKLLSECVCGQRPVLNLDFQDKLTGKTLSSWALVPFAWWQKAVNDSNNHS